MPPRPASERAALTHAATLRFNLVELETFLVVVELGNFSLAAQRLNIAQPSVTGRVQRLEATLKTRLLTRTTRRVEPTEAGLLLQREAELALHGLRSLMHRFLDEADVARRSVTIASTQMLAAVVLPPVIRTFSVRYPDVHVHLRDLHYRDVLHRVETGEADVGVVAFDNDSSKLSFETLMNEELLLVLPDTSPLANRPHVALADFAPFAVLLLDRYSLLRTTLTEAFAARGLALHASHEATNLSTLLGMVDAGLGVTFLPRSMAQQHARGNRVALPVSDATLTRSFGIVRPRHGELNTATQSFIRHLREQVGSVA